MLITSEQHLREILPMLQVTVKGSMPWIERMRAHLDRATKWFETYICPEPILADDIRDTAAVSIAWKALSTAIPTLDLIGTPTGFAVTSTDTLAPASRERTANAQTTARATAEHAACAVLRRMRHEQRWQRLNHAALYNNLIPDPEHLALLATPYIATTGTAATPHHDPGNAPHTYYITHLQEIRAAERNLVHIILNRDILRHLRAVAATGTPDVTVGSRPAATEAQPPEALTPDAPHPGDLEIIDAARRYILRIITHDPTPIQTSNSDTRAEIHEIIEQHPDSPAARKWHASSASKTYRTHENKKHSGGYFF